MKEKSSNSSLVEAQITGALTTTRRSRSRNIFLKEEDPLANQESGDFHKEERRRRKIYVGIYKQTKTTISIRLTAFTEEIPRLHPPLPVSESIESKKLLEELAHSKKLVIQEPIGSYEDVDTNPTCGRVEIETHDHDPSSWTRGDPSSSSCCSPGASDSKLILDTMDEAKIRRSDHGTRRLVVVDCRSAQGRSESTRWKPSVIMTQLLIALTLVLLATKPFNCFIFARPSINSTRLATTTTRLISEKAVRVKGVDTRMREKRDFVRSSEPITWKQHYRTREAIGFSRAPLLHNAYDENNGTGHFNAKSSALLSFAEPNPYFGEEAEEGQENPQDPDQDQNFRSDLNQNHEHPNQWPSTTTTSNNNKQRISRVMTIKTEQHGHFRGKIVDINNRNGENSGSYSTSKLRGSKVVAFLGIKYAKSPERHLRFMPPSAYFYAANLEHDLTRWGSICMQRWPALKQQQTSHITTTTNNRRNNMNNLLNEWERVLPKKVFGDLQDQYKKVIRFNQSEDCLNLNIFVPHEVLSGSQIEKQVPVLVLVHGHSYDYGSGNTLDGASFVARQRESLIVITLNYRLNLLGFPPKIKPISSGNLGTLDLIAALIWIQGNVKSFGGSPSKITLFGLDKGATLVHLLMLSPLAKGLFQRVILEDGSALSPWLANQVNQHQWSAAGHSNYHSQTFQNSFINTNQNAKSLQYLRLLAKLNDCPSSSTSFRSQTSASNSTTASTSNISINNKQAEIAISQNYNQSVQLNNPNLNQIKAGAPVIETQMSMPMPIPIHSQPPNPNLNLNSASSSPSAAASISVNKQMDSISAFECLRRHPIDSLMQLLQIPPDELQLLTSSGQLHNHHHHHEVASNHQLLASTLPLATPGDEPSDQTQSSARFQAESPMPANSVIPFRPIFGPTVDQMLIWSGSEDLANLMLSSNSSFRQFDLMLGFSSESPLPTTRTHNETLSDSQDNQFHSLAQDGETSDSEQLISEFNILASSLSRQHELNGISSSQAMELISNFVRTFYRYHDQEISNSLIEHYPPPRVKLDDKDGQQTNQERANRLSLLESISEALQDALVRVPLIRTALIHSLQQVDLQRQLLTIKLTKLFIANGSTDYSTELLQSESNLAKLLLNEGSQSEVGQSLPSQDEPGQVNSSPLKATYLYQSRGKSALLTLLEQASEKLNVKFKLTPLSSNGNVTGVNSSFDFAWTTQLEPLLKSSLSALRKPAYPLKLGLACAFDQPEKPSAEMEADEEPSGGQPGEVYLLAHRLNAWFCSRFDPILTNFAAFGRIGANNENKRRESRHKMGIENSYTNAMEGPSPNWSLFENRRCSILGSHSNGNNDNGQQTAEEEIGFCRRLRTRLTFELVVAEMAQLIDSQSTRNLRSNTELLQSNSETIWLAPFNQLERRVVQLGEPPGSWSTSEIFDSNKQLDHRSSFAARASFWLNSLPALNCSRTQPLHAAAVDPNHSYLGRLLGDNSPLLRLNLVFNCQIGPRNSYDVIHTHVKNIKQTLSKAIQQQLAADHQHSGTQSFSKSHNYSQIGPNHHKLRMANSNENSAEPQTSNETTSSGISIADHQSQSSTNKQQQTHTTFEVVSIEDSGQAGSSSGQLDNARGKVIIPIVIVVVCCACTISFLLILFVIKNIGKRSHRGSRSRRTSPQDQSIDQQQSPNSTNNQLDENYEEKENSLELDNQLRQDSLISCPDPTQRVHLSSTKDDLIPQQQTGDTRYSIGADFTNCIPNSGYNSNSYNPNQLSFEQTPPPKQQFQLGEPAAHFNRQERSFELAPKDNGDQYNSDGNYHQTAHMQNGLDALDSVANLCRSHSNIQQVNNGNHNHENPAVHLMPLDNELIRKQAQNYNSNSVQNLDLQSHDGSSMLDNQVLFSRSSGTGGGCASFLPNVYTQSASNTLNRFPREQNFPNFQHNDDLNLSVNNHPVNNQRQVDWIQQKFPSTSTNSTSTSLSLKKRVKIDDRAINSRPKTYRTSHRVRLSSNQPTAADMEQVEISSGYQLYELDPSMIQEQLCPVHSSQSVNMLLSVQDNPQSEIGTTMNDRGHFKQQQEQHGYGQIIHQHTQNLLDYQLLDSRLHHNQID